MSLTTDKNDPRLKRNETGQNEIYLVLSEEERAKGFVRPVRDTYIHTGKKIQRDEEGRIVGEFIRIDESSYPADEYYTAEKGYGGFIRYPEGHSLQGRYITTEEADAIRLRKTHFGGCGTKTKMGFALAETYARDPKFYGATFCMGCNKHLLVSEFTWDGTDEEVGS